MRATTVPLLAIVVFSTQLAAVCGWNHWTNATIPLDIDADLDPVTLERFKMVIAYMEKYTCVRFPIGNQSDVTPRLHVDSKKCCAISYSGGDIGLAIGGSAWPVKGLFHETFHTFGVAHTHQRPDWHHYLNKTTIKDGEYSYETFNRHGIPYDYASSATNGGFATFDPRFKDSLWGLHSFYDFLESNVQQDCFDRCIGVPKPACKNGGVVDVNNCTKCSCPDPYAGDFCEERSLGNAAVDCGKTIDVTDTVQTVEMPAIGKPNEVFDFTHCYYLLKATSCKRVKVTILDVPDRCVNGCEWTGLSVYGNIDKRQTGYRYCCHNRLNETVISDYNTLALDAYSWNDAKENTYTYKIDVVAVD